MRNTVFLYSAIKHFQWLLLVVVTKDIVNAQGSCGTIGTVTSNERYDRDGTERLYINTEHPAPYNGLVTRWYYCHYLPYLTVDKRRQTTFAIYRQKSEGLERVSEPIVIQESESLTISLEERFKCDNFKVSPAISIQKGDMIGACIHDSLDTSHELNIIGINAPQNFILTFANNQDCMDGLMPSTVSNDSLMQVDSKVMHLHADIECLPESQLNVTKSSTDPEPLLYNSTSPENSTRSEIYTSPENSTSSEISTSSSPLTDVHDGKPNIGSEIDRGTTSDVFFVIQIAGIIAGLVVSLVLLVTITICIIVCCVCPKGGSNTKNGLKQRKCANHETVQKMVADKRSRTFKTHTNKPNSEELSQSEPVYTVVNNIYQKTAIHESERSGNIYSYPTFYRVIIK